MRFQIRTYDIASEKIRDGLTLLFLADYHAYALGEDKEALLSLCRRENVAAVLFPGDAVFGASESAADTAVSFLAALASVAPVWFSNGNHETKLRVGKPESAAIYRRFLAGIRAQGVHVLNNRTAVADIAGNEICLAGLELPISAYKKFRRPKMRADVLTNRLGAADAERFTVLLAHNPQFADAYFDWGADLTLCGHFHGGLIRSPGSGRALLDPYGFPLPRYGYGAYRRDGKELLVTSGIGDHWLSLRIFNPREAVLIHVHGTKEQS